MRELQHLDMVLFSSKEQLMEYCEETDFASICPSELEATFPQIQSKHWSVALSKAITSRTFEAKRAYMGRLISYEQFKLKD